MKKVLIITYYWPPSGGAGVQRWLKFAKYLPVYGWKPVIYTPENPDFAIEDQSLLKDISLDLEVIKRPIWEPYEIYKTLIGKKGQKVNVSFTSTDKKQNKIHKMALAVRGNLLIPDPRCFWIKPSTEFLLKYLKENPVDAIISTGPPHSMHLIAHKIHEKTGLPWVADFRDPWTNIDFYRELNLTWLADKIHHRLERKILNDATRVVSVTPTWCRELSELGNKETILVHNGYDEDDIEKTQKPVDTKFALVHIGSLNAARNPQVLWKTLGELVNEIPELKSELRIRFVGNVEDVVLQELASNNLSEFVDNLGYMSHNEAIHFQQLSPVLLLLINNTPNSKGILTGKLYEYMASERPILAIGPTDSDISRILAETNSGIIVDFDDIEATKTAIRTLFEMYQQKNLKSQSSNYTQYSRKAQCGVFAEILNEITPASK